MGGWDGIGDVGEASAGGSIGLMIYCRGEMMGLGDSGMMCDTLREQGGDARKKRHESFVARARESILLSEVGQMLLTVPSQLLTSMNMPVCSLSERTCDQNILQRSKMFTGNDQVSSTLDGPQAHSRVSNTTCSWDVVIN